MTCDQYGYMWFATESGLVKFNGKNFEKVDLLLNDNEIVNIYQKEDVLFLFNFTGQMAGVDLATHHIIDTKELNSWLQKDAYLQSISVAGIISDTFYLSDMRQTGSLYTRIGSMVFCKSGRGHFWNKLIEHYKVPPEFPAAVDIYHAGIKRIYGLQHTDNTLIADNIIYYIENKSVKQIFNGSDYNLEGTIMAFARIRDDLYVGYYENYGLLKFENYFKEKETIKRLPQTIIPGKKILGLTRDHADNLWVSIYKDGLTMLPSGMEAIKHYDKENGGLHDNDINYIQQEGRRLLIAYKDGHLDIKDSSGIVSTTVRFPGDGYDVKHIITGNRYWNILTTSGISSFRSSAATGLPYAAVMKTIAIPVKDVSPGDGSSYFAAIKTNYMILNRDTLPVGIQSFPFPAMSVIKLPEGQMVYGALRGLYIDDYIVPGTENERFNVVRYFDGDLVACSMRAVYIIQKGKIVRRITHKDGLLGSTYADVQAAPGFYYIRSESGITIIDRNTLRIAGMLSGKDFIVPIRINSFSLYNHSIDIATDKGIFEMPEQYLYRKRNAPPIYIHPVTENGQLSPIRDSVRMLYSPNRSIHLQVDVLDYRGNEPQLWYAVSRDGAPATDTTALFGRVLHLENMLPGNYIITISAASAQDQWKVFRNYQLTILPLWYQTISFRVIIILGSVLIIAGAIWLIYRRRLRAAQQKFANRTRLAELQSQALFAQMKPHFIFNALNPLQGFILKNQKEDALDYLEKFAALTRELLNQSRDKYSTLPNELAFVEHYLFIAQTRFGGKFTYGITVSPDISKDLLIPTMLLQPLAENAVDHGVKSLAENEGMIQVYVDETPEGALRILVSDNGSGFPEAHFIRENHALQIIEERLELLKEETGIGSIVFRHNRQEERTEVLLLLPALKNGTANETTKRDHSR